MHEGEQRNAKQTRHGNAEKRIGREMNWQMRQDGNIRIIIPQTIGLPTPNIAASAPCAPHPTADAFNKTKCKGWVKFLIEFGQSRPSSNSTACTSVALQLV